MRDSGLSLPWKQLPAEAASSEGLTKMTSPGDQSQPKVPPGQKDFNHLNNPPWQYDAAGTPAARPVAKG